MNGRRFIWRWAARTLRKEWRQHTVILGLLILGAAAAITLALTAYNMAEPSTRYAGNAQTVLNSNNSEQLNQALRENGVRYGKIERSTVDRNGTTEEAAIRVLDPNNSTIAPLIDLLEGRYPSSNTEVAVTDKAFGDQPAIGTSLALDGHTVTVVGVVENPMFLSEEFVLANTLEPFTTASETAEVDFYVEGDPNTLNLGVNYGSTDVGGLNKSIAGLLGNVVGAFGMLEVALLVGASFAVIGRRRARQYGLLAAAGAEPKALRSAATMSGAILGAVGAVAGLFIGIALARVLVAALESTLNYRVAFAIPATVILPNAVLAVAVAAWASRRPAAKLSHESVMSILSSTRPKPEPVGRAAAVGAVITVLGAALLMAGFARFDELMALGGVVLGPLGLLLMSPLLVRGIGMAAARFPLAERLAGRAIGRYNRRSAAVVAAIALALSIPMGIAVVTESIDSRAASSGPNLGENAVILWQPEVDDIPAASMVPVRMNDARLTASKDAAATAAPTLEFVPIITLVPNNYLEQTWVENGVEATIGIPALRRLTSECVFCDSDVTSFGSGDGTDVSYNAQRLWVASPGLLTALGLETAWLDTGSLAIAQTAQDKVGGEGILLEGDQITVGQTWTDATVVPPVLVSPQVASQYNFAEITVGWLGTSPNDLTVEQRAAIRGASPNTVVEFFEPPEPKGNLRTIGLLIGMLVGIGITISAVGLLSAELSGDVALLASLGATPRSGRRMSAAIAALLALAGGLLGAIIGYLPLLPMINAKADNFPFVVPFQFLIGLLIFFPLISAATGWFMSKNAAQGTSMRELV